MKHNYHFIFFDILRPVRHAVTRNDDGFEGSHLHALGRILKRTVGLSYNKHIGRTVGPVGHSHGNGKLGELSQQLKVIDRWTDRVPAE